jgi:hypothetical protein
VLTVPRSMPRRTVGRRHPFLGNASPGVSLPRGERLTGSPALYSTVPEASEQPRKRGFQHIPALEHLQGWLTPLMAA